MRLQILPGIVGLLVASYGLAQQPPTPAAPEPDVEPTIKVDVDLVNILCSVRDKHGTLISNLEKDDFVLKEDGKAQDIKYFTRESNLPLTLGLLVDISPSQRNLIDVERQAAYQFFSSVLRKKDMAFLISFGPDAELLQDYTNSPNLLEDGLNGLKVHGDVGGIGPGPVPTMDHPRGTVLFDAVYLAAHEKLRSEVGRKAVVLITDGVDVGSRLKLQDAIEAAQKADTIIYSICYSDPSAYGWGFGRTGDSDLRKMSEETGGRLFRVSRKNTLQDIFQEIQAEMRSQYALGYTPSNSAKDGTFREIDVKTRRDGLKVQARKGYYAMARH